MCVSFLSYVIFSVCLCVVVCFIPIFDKSLSNNCVHPMSNFFCMSPRVKQLMLSDVSSC